MNIGDRCLLKDAPSNAVLLSVAHLPYAVQWPFAVVKGRNTRVECYEGGGPGGHWVAFPDLLTVPCIPTDQVVVVAFYEGELPVGESESY